ncbi:type III secretion HpaP family protein [Dyella acidisoli]|uniref:Flagellar hook-length control protein FliK n=1 Tax=Dyella acidisoli TaxID=1867834 RepID=A0ABQ5XRI0_9GAMM|nr:type III secretion HpaP family protein [Dyella acidisoli]GLQ93638.1 hypothetical protein GCM10007901_25890 [Dyella acidisoli]
MHTQPPTSPSSHSSALSTRRATREAHAETPQAGNPENVNRFRTLMNGKRQDVPDGSPDSSLGEESAVDIETADVEPHAFSPDQEQALRDLLQRQLNEKGDPLLSLLSPRKGDDNSEQQDDDRGDGQGAANMGMQTLHLAQQAIVQSAEQPAAASAAMAPALAELIERHVKQLLVPDASSHSAAQSREIMITLKDGLLPGTELWLSRTSDGWKLRADTRSSAAYHSLVEGAPQLIERFAQSRLGALEITPTLLA